MLVLYNRIPVLLFYIDDKYDPLEVQVENTEVVWCRLPVGGYMLPRASSLVCADRVPDFRNRGCSCSYLLPPRIGAKKADLI
jgi:hypothetical protein